MKKLRKQKKEENKNAIARLIVEGYALFPNLYTPRSSSGMFKDEVPSYSVTIRIPKTDKKTISAVKQAFKDVCEKMNFSKKLTKQVIEKKLEDGDKGKHSEYSDNHGCYLLRSKSKDKPSIYTKEGKDLVLNSTKDLVSFNDKIAVSLGVCLFPYLQKEEDIRNVRMGVYINGVLLLEKIDGLSESSDSGFGEAYGLKLKKKESLKEDDEEEEEDEEDDEEEDEDEEEEDEEEDDDKEDDEEEEDEEEDEEDEDAGEGEEDEEESLPF